MKDKFKRLYSTIHADEGLVQHTLQAAKQQESRRRRSHLMLIPAVAALLCIVMVSAFLRNGTPEDTVAANGEISVNGEGFDAIPVLDPYDITIAAAAPILHDTTGEQQDVVLQYVASTDMGGTSCLWLSAEGAQVHADMRITMTLTVDESGESCRLSAVASMFDEAAQRASFLVPLIDSESGSPFSVAGGTSVTLTLESWTNPPQMQPDGSTLNTRTLSIRNPQELHFRMGGVGEKRLCDGYVYEILADGTVKLYTVLWGSSNTIVPAELDGRQVSSIGTAFAANDKLESITLPEGITVIGVNAFLDCENLKEVHLPDGLLEIAPTAFAGCSALESIHIPDSVTSIGQEAFAWCTSLKEVHLPASLTDLGYGAFTHAALEYVDIPNGLTHLPEFAFSSAFAQPRVSIPASVTDIDTNAFQWGVSMLIVEPDSYAEDFARAMDYTYEYAEGLEATPRYVSGDWGYTVQPDGSARLESYAGTDTHVIIPDTLDGYTVSSVGVCFAGNDTIIHVTLPESMTEVAPMAFYNCDALASVRLPDILASIGSYAFGNCDALAEIELPDSLQTIGKWAFNPCDSLHEITIPASVTEIGVFAFTTNPSATTLRVTPDSYAESYAKESSLAYLLIETD